jgi:hypothetical protein
MVPNAIFYIQNITLGSGYQKAILKLQDRYLIFLGFEKGLFVEMQTKVLG